jgi:lysophospholipase L1-like esterase
MIGGFPHRFENSFFHLATERLRLEFTHHLSSSLYTLGGFPAPRAIRHLPTHGLAEKPDIVVLQFGSSDLAVPVRRKSRQPAITAQARATAHPAGPVRPLHWHLQGLIGDLLQLPSVTAPEAYLEAMNQMIRTVAAYDAVPVVMSPFVLGSPRADRIARQCVPALAKVVAAVPGARYLEVYSILDEFPRREILLRDGTHLTIQGQVLVSEGLFTVLARLLREQETMATGEAA